MKEVLKKSCFILDDKIVTIDFARQKISPTTTVLNYLRSLPGHKGVKEGCAEGDCGACTVVIAELNNRNKLSYKAVNSCLVFLPMIHGKQIITIENLAVQKGYDVILHPVQQALVEMNGSQCGFCTPGVVMSMFSIFKNHVKPSRETVVSELAGNLCRCTGYQSIYLAMEKALTMNRKDRFLQNEKHIISLLKEINGSKKPLLIFTDDQKYLQPYTIKESLAFRKKYPNAILINGSTDIALKQTKKFEILHEVIDLSRVRELKFYRNTNKKIIIGTGLSLEKIRQLSSGVLPAFNSMLDLFASKQIRNIATLGGNICTASPIGDTLPLLIAYGAVIRLTGMSGERRLPVEKFIKGYRKTDLKKDELMHSILIPKSENNIVGFYKISKRRDVDISTVSAAFNLKLTDGLITNICIVFGGMAEIPKRAMKTEKFLVGRKWEERTVKKSMTILYAEFNPISDARSDAEFRRIAAKNLLMKFYLETMS